MRILSRSQLVFGLTLGLILGLGVGAVSAYGPGTGWLPGLVAALVFLYYYFRKPLRRQRATRNPLPAHAIGWLERHIAVYRRLAPDARCRFDADVQIVLDEWLFEGVGQVEVASEMKLGVAAGAALLLHGRPEWELPPRQTVLFYPDTFDDDYRLENDGDFEGMAHQQGPVILSTRALHDSWSNGEDGRNVVLHELAHLLDYKTNFADGVPSLLDARSAAAWRALVRKEMRRIRQGRSILDRYGATDPAEFFAVAVENFFERPGPMEIRHPKLFSALVAIFGMDPRTGMPREGTTLTAHGTADVP